MYKYLNSALNIDYVHLILAGIRNIKNKKEVKFKKIQLESLEEWDLEVRDNVSVFGI